MVQHAGSLPESEAPGIAGPQGFAAEPGFLADAVRRHAQQRPDKMAFVERGGDGTRMTVTWAAVERLVEESASAYDRLGLVAGQRAALLMTNSIEACVAWFGALRAGVVAVPLNPRLADAELARELDHCGATVLLADEDRPVPDGVRLVALTGHHAGVEPGLVASVPDPEALAAIVYTSGSQRVPRGAMFTHRSLVASCRASQAAGIATDDAVVLGMLPLCHMYGLNAIVGAAVYAGATTVLVEGMADDICEVIVAEQITHLPVTPSALYRLVQDDALAQALGSVRMVSSGAAPMPAVLGEKFTALTGLRVEQGYGMTEAAPGISSTVGHPLLGPGHVGRALPGVELRIGADDSPEPDLLHVRCDNLFSGYWPDGEGGADPDGWFVTGDIAYLTDDDLFILDRVGELIIVSGFNVYPSEIEEVLEQHPSVEGAAVVGAPDERTGERIVAFLEGGKVAPAAVRAHALASLARYKVPTQFVVVKSIPRTSTGKPRKGVLRDMLDRVEEEY